MCYYKIKLRDISKKLNFVGKKKVLKATYTSEI